MTIRFLLRPLALILWLAAGAAGAAADPSLAGLYDAKGRTADNIAYGGQVGIEPRGKAVVLTWRLDGGDGYRGLALQLDDVLGGVYWSDKAGFNDPGIVVYRIDGGTLRGIWMPQDGRQDLLGREDLVGPASLEGRFEIALGEHPGGGSHYAGHVDIDRHGDTYYFHWFAPQDSYVGNGVRIGNIMVVGYAMHQAPGTVAYCIRDADLDGVWSYGQDTRLGRETLHRQSATITPGPSAKANRDCLPTVAMEWQPAPRN